MELLQNTSRAEAERREFLQIVDQETKRLTRLITDFLDLQRLEQGAENQALRPVDLAELLRAGATLFGRDMAGRIVLDVPDDLPLVRADPDRIQQVLANLVSNAVKYSPEGGLVRIEARRVEERIEVAVVDQGRGLTPDVLGRLFTGFYRAEEAQQQGIVGTGLGLVIARQLVEAQGGTITAQSAGAGQGSTFRFTLPIAAHPDGVQPDPTH